MTVLVTGAAGHLGNNIVRALLARERKIRVLVHSESASLHGLNVEKREGDIRKQYPDVTEQKVATLMLGLTELCHERLDHVTHHLFSPHLESLSNIMQDVAHIQRTEALNPKDDLASWDMALLVFDLIRDEFADLHVDEADPAVPDKLKRKVKPGKATNSVKSSQP